MDQKQQKQAEALGPAERVIQSLISFTDHFQHGRPGMVVKDPKSPIGVSWGQVIWKKEDDKRVVYRMTKVGKKSIQTKVGSMTMDKDTVKEGRAVIGEYRSPGLFPETVEYFYRQIAEVWKLDNEFSARWASWAFPREHKDLKVALAAFMLVQSRKGDGVMEDGKMLFRDEDYRAVGEAMCLTQTKHGMDPKLLLRIRDVLRMPGVAAINRELKFGNSARNPAMGRYPLVVAKWLKFRDENPRILEGLVKAAFRTTVKELAILSGYKGSPKFYEILRWKQVQAKDGRRTVAIGTAVKAAQTWEGKTEEEICKIICETKPDWKRIASQLPKGMGLTRAIVGCAVETGCMSNQDLIILTPTLEELGLLKEEEVSKRWKTAIEKAENQRAANIAKNVRTKVAKEGLQDAVDKATEKVLTEVTKAMRVYVVVDKSGSMEGALDKAQEYLTKFLGGFPLDRLHVSVFNTMGTEVTIKSPKAAAVKQAFMGHRAGGGTSYAMGVQVLSHHKPKEDEDAIIIFVGDEQDSNYDTLAHAVRNSGINPVAFGLLKMQSNGGYIGDVVTRAAGILGIPCFGVDEKMFTSNDPYAITRMLRDLIASTPVGKRVGGVPLAKPRKTLVEEILETPLLTIPLAFAIKKG